MDKQRSYSDRCPFACACSSNNNVRFETNSRPRPRNSKNRWAKPKTNGMFRSCQLCHRFFKWNFLKQVGHAKTRLPDQRLCQPVRPYLLIINEQTHQKVYYLSYLALYLKIAKESHQHAHSTILTHDTRAQGPTLERTSRDVSDTRVWHTACTL